MGGSGHRPPPGRAETREAGPAAGPSNKAETHRKVRPLVTPGHKPQQLKSKPAALEMLEIAEYERLTALSAGRLMVRGSARVRASVPAPRAVSVGARAGFVRVLELSGERRWWCGKDVASVPSRFRPAG